MLDVDILPYNAFFLTMTERASKSRGSSRLRKANQQTVKRKWKKLGEVSTLLALHIKERCSLTLGFFSPSVIASGGFDISMSGKALD
jgi:hypothetical protein